VWLEYAEFCSTMSMVLNWVRFVDGVHFFARERREEVRLLGTRGKESRRHAARD
jgi:hypothetical protein